tara:strand:+ start:3257 stop:4057 length:801 start_codon:yes stop_codon:yes gene_type:complete
MIKIIAEIGWNHCGDIDLAKKMAKEAQLAGATYAKYQTWSVDRLKPGSWDSDGRKQIYEKAELSKQDHITLIDYCTEIGIKFLSSVFSIPDAQLLVELGVREVKIPSFESRNEELIRYCDNNFDNVFMSCGTSTLDEIANSIKLFEKSILYLMHCVSVYPGTYEIANLPKMKVLMSMYHNVGYSDHIQGVESAKIAIGEGAVVVEKHFTIDNDLPGRDNKFAILPKELNDLTSFIKNRELMFTSTGMGYNPKEKDSRNNYEGRFNK